MRENHVKRLLTAGQPAIGTWLSLPSPQVAANRRIGEGFQFIAVASELRFMLAGAREVINGVTLPDGRRLGQQTAESVRY